MLELEIGGLIADSEYAQLDINGNVALAGDLEITLTNGFSPTAGNSFDILDWGSLSGTFSTVTLPPLAAGFNWDPSQLYSTGVLSVVGPPSFTADFDEDGDVDGDDLAQWQGDFGANDLSDADGDNDSDGNDFLVWQQQVGSAPAGAAATGVPEPKLAALMAGGMLAAAPACCCSRRRRAAG